MIELIILVLAILVSPLAAFVLRKRFPTWGSWRVVMLGALPIPGVIWALCLLIFINAATASEESCGVDACGMAMMASSAVAGMAFLVYLGCLVFAWVGDHLAGRRLKPPDVTSTFE